MAGWWMPVAQLRVMRALDKGFVMHRCAKTDTYWWAVGGKCTPQGRALRNKGLITIDTNWRQGDWSEVVRITPTGRNELNSNRHREID
ncbi:hypothetical protein TUM17564_39290 [Citrobacter freundii]|nr:hypothetical protein TUM17564_39290 [Citrobacter freundii]